MLKLTATKVSLIILFIVMGASSCCYSSQQQPTVLLVFNGHYAQEAENLLASIKTNSPEIVPFITICASDDHSRNFALRHKLRMFEMSTISDTGTYLSRNFNIMTKRKFEAIVHLLELKQDVLYIDTDIVLLTNPFPEMDKSVDLNIQNDQCASPYDLSYLCTGFMYINSNHRTISFFRQAIDEIVKSDYKMCDQCALNLLIKNKYEISINVLDVCKFPNGCRYFKASDKNCSKRDALIVHNNYLKGIDKKFERFARHGLIFYEG